MRLRTSDPCRRWADIGLGEIEREGASLARRAAKLDLATEQAGEFAADGQAKPSAAVLPAGSRVRLLEGLEDDALLFRREYRCPCPKLQRR